MISKHLTIAAAVVLVAGLGMGSAIAQDSSAPGAAPQYLQQPAPGPPQPLTEPVQRTPLPPAPVQQ